VQQIPLNINSLKQSSLPKILIYIGIILIPFDNLKFAPSDGWAAISPYIFTMAAAIIFFTNRGIFQQILSKLNFKKLLIFQLIAMLSLVSYMIYGFYINLIILNVAKILLGLSFLICIYYMHLTSDKWTDKLVSSLAIGYTVAIIFGVLQLFSILGIFSVTPLFEILFSRNYPNRIQFSFTEPSFVSMHLIGVMLVVLIFSVSIKNWGKKILFINFICIILISVLSGSSLRVLVDLALISTVFIVFMPFRKKIYILFATIFLSAFVLFINPSKELQTRIDRVFDSNSLSDPSAAIRKFRVESAINGTNSNFFTTLFGFGFGNSAKAMEYGYDAAYTKLNSTYGEIESLKDNPDGLTYSMHAKLISENGFIGYLVILIILYNRKYKILFFITAVTYLQFDSFAFYTLWLYIYARIFNVGSDSSIISNSRA
jgi:hypothetical protein